MRTLRSHTALSLFVAVLVFFFFGCRENTLINSKVAPANNAVNVYDTSLPCITHTFYSDTAQTSTNLSGIPIYQAVGTITDPYFGVMQGATFFQVVPLDPDTAWFSNNTVDSAVLILPYSGFTYGDTASTAPTQTYQVFYMTDTLGYNTEYFSYNTKAVDATFPLSDPYTVNVHSIADSMGYVVALPQDYPGIRIPLKLNSLIHRLATGQHAVANTGNYFQNFIAAFNGICVRSANTMQSSSAIPYFQLDGGSIFTQAGIVLYYRPNSALSDTELVTNYYFNTAYCAHFNSVSKSYSHYPVANLLRSAQANDSVIALQNLPGAAIDLKIPGITHLPKGVINKAEIQIPLIPGTFPPDIPFSGPSKVYPSGVGNGVYPNTTIGSGLTYVIADYYPISSVSPLLVLDGYPHLINGYWTYTIDIPREVIASMKANNDTLHLQINGTQEFYGAYHMVAGGGGNANPALRPKLKVVYSKLN